MGQLSFADFNKSTTDKVFRLFELLEAIERHPKLSGKFALHGGTAINLFMLDVPRLSVDIDISYIGSAKRDEMLEARASIEDSIEQIGKTLGYEVSKKKAEHAGTTFKFNYEGPEHPDQVKIDINYLNRLPLIAVEMRETPLKDGLKVRSFSNEELIGGKVKAFFERVKVRDLYDISNLYGLLEKQITSGSPEEKQLHQVILFNASISKRFPFGFEDREQRFSDLQEDVVKELHPMLRRTSDFQTLEAMMSDAKSFIERWVLPKSDQEQEFLDRFEQCDYNPSLLFDNPDIVARAEQSPPALWKLQNLKKRNTKPY